MFRHNREGFFSHNKKTTSSDKALPNLIFGETHDDPAVKIILLKMLDKLAELGYTSFYLEYPQDIQIDTVIGHLKQRQQLYSRMVETIYSNTGQIPTYEYMKKIHWAKYMENRSNRSALKEIIAIERLPGDMALLSLLLEIQNSKDIVSACIDINTKERDTIDTKSPEGIDNRNQVMAERFLNSDKPVFGLVGVDHMQGIRDHLKESNHFEYIVIHTSTNLGLNQSEIEKLPKEVHLFNLATIKQDEVIESILGIIKNHFVLAESSEFTKS